jgi:acyl dehydratase
LVNFGGAGMIEVGTVIPERVFKIDRATLKKYADASGDQNPIHQNEEFAKSVGLPDVIAHGMFTMALVGKFATDWAGGSGTIKEYSTRFTKPVVVPANKSVDLIVSGVVGEILPSGLVRLDLTATSDGQKVLGMARAIVDVNGKSK